MRRLLPRFLIIAGLTGAAAAAGASPAAAACTVKTKPAGAKVVLWANPGCTGGGVVVPNTGDDDRPDFTRFRNANGKLYDVARTRSSVTLAAGYCARFFTRANYGGGAALYCAGRATTHFNIHAIDNAASSMRVCPEASRLQCAKVPRTLPRNPTPQQTANYRASTIVEQESAVNDPLPTDVDASPDAEPDPGIAPLPDPVLQADPAVGVGTGTAEQGAPDLGPLAPVDVLRFDPPGARCSGGSTVGARALRLWMEETAIAQRRRADVYRCSRARGGHVDLDATGRAVDFQPATKAAGLQLVALLLADDASLVRRMGVQEIIYDGTTWTANRPTPAMRPYSGPSPHRTSVHVGLNRLGANLSTSFWVGR